ncbi:hypothetical protein OG762_42505 [Streptomyces sp. NBC_01136]|nr:hypothetical protein OG762_42505 [Streptomyces sp. NBC_01136]
MAKVFATALTHEDVDTRRRVRRFLGWSTDGHWMRPDPTAVVAHRGQ